MWNKGGRNKKEYHISQHMKYNLTVQTHLCNRCDSLGNENTISAVHGSLQLPSVSSASWLMGLSDPSREEVRHLLYLGTFDIHFTRYVIC